MNIEWQQYESLQDPGSQQGLTGPSPRDLPPVNKYPTECLFSTSPAFLLVISLINFLVPRTLCQPNRGKVCYGTLIQALCGVLLMKEGSVLTKQ